MTQLVPINVAEVTEAVKRLLVSSPDVGGAGVAIERAARPNTDLRANGWVGIYRQSVRIAPRALGVNQGSRQQMIDLVLMAQEQHALSGEGCEDKLESLVQRVCSVLITDGSLGNTVDMVGEIEVRYTDYLRDEKSSVYTQNAAIYVPGIVLVRSV